MMNSAVCLLDLAAEKYKEHIAIWDDGEEITYKKYRQLSLRVATYLISKRHSSDCKPVIVYLKKSISALACFMGTLYSASPYVPVDINIPSYRLSKIIDSVKPEFIITDKEHSELLLSLELFGAKVCVYDDIVKTEPDEFLVQKNYTCTVDTDPIYIMYTSGSTGNPKGVTIPHRGIIDYAQWVVNTFSFDENTAMANQAPFYFDNSTFDIYGCMRCGGKLVLIPDALMMFPLKLPEFLKVHDITSIFFVPTVMINIANSGALENISLPKLKNVAFCGEVMPNKQLNIWRRALPECSYANLYGPTEITDVCCYYRIEKSFEDSDALPIGKACENMRVYIFDENNKIAKINEIGELCVTGSGVALGYWNAPDITARSFCANPLASPYFEWMYRTGDLAYVDDEGLIMFAGRRDSQVKIKGNRIEMGEIETAAMCIDDVENSCVLFDDKKQELVLFIETKKEITLRKFNVELKKYVPAYMLPSKLICMKALPHTANDKIDRIALRSEL